jgi:hypothetical protein
VTGRGLRLGEELLEEAAGVVTQRAAGDERPAVVGEGVEAPLEPGGVGLGVGDRVPVGVDGGVEHHGAHAVGVELGVGRAERGAVGVAEEVQLLLAQGLPQLLHVPGGVHGVEGAQRLAVLVGAALGHLAREGEDVVELLVGRRARLCGDRAVLELLGDALHGGGQAHAARVEADDVEAAQHVLREGERQADGGVGARAARAAGVDHQRSDAVGLPGQHRADEEERQRGAAGLVVADRHVGAAALEGEVALAARLPLDERLDLRVAVGPLDRGGLGLGRCRARRRGLLRGLTEGGAAAQHEGQGQEQAGGGGREATVQTHDHEHRYLPAAHRSHELARPPAGARREPASGGGQGVLHPSRTSARS